MAITIHETNKSRTTTEETAHERLYIIQGTSDESAALSTLLATAPATSNGLTRDKCTVEVIGIAPDGAGGFLKPGSWLGTAPYSPSSESDPPNMVRNEIEVTYETGGGTQHITQALAVLDSYAPGTETPEDFKGAIGVTGDGDVEGTDIGVRQMNLTVTKCMAKSDLPDPGDTYVLTWTTNDDTFGFTDSRTGQVYSFAAGELLLSGVSGPRIRQDGLAELTYQFSAAPNVTGLSVGDINGIAKRGWDNLWVYYTPGFGARGQVQVPDTATVVQVYYEGNHTLLGI